MFGSWARLIALLLLLWLALGCLPDPPSWSGFPCHDDVSCGKKFDCVEGFCRSRCDIEGKCDKGLKCVKDNCLPTT